MARWLPADLYATSLQMIDLVELLDRDVQARRVVLLLDTCYSGAATSTRGVAVRAANPPAAPAEFSAAADRFDDKTAEGVARVVISASRAGEESREDEKLRHGYFTYFLLEALRRNSGNTSVGEVFEWVHDRTVEAVRKRFGVSQTPTMRNSAEGLAMVIGAPAAASPAGIP